MTPDVCVLWRDADGPVLEGGRARRVGLVKALGARAAICRLRGGYADAFLASLVAAARTEARAVLVWFPDLPVWMPAGRLKLPFALAWLALLKLVLAVRGRSLLVDVGDVPRHQSRSLRYELSGGQIVWLALERALFALADRVAVPNEVLGEWLVRDHGLPRAKLRVVPNGAPRELLHVPRRAGGRPARFAYVGSLDSTQDRGVRALCRAFAARAPGDVELLLIGERGDWVEREFPVPGIRVLGALPEERTYEWLAVSDLALIPYPTDGYYAAVSPTKLALYALARVPVISTSMEMSKRLIERHRLGEVMPPEELFANWPAVLRKYHAFPGGERLEELTWDSAAAALVA